MTDRIKVIHVKSLSYTGTTWLNTVLGCHADAFTLGPLDLRWKHITGEENGPACLIHEDACDFWPGFQKTYSPENNFFVELARYSRKNYFVTNNLLDAGAGRHLNHRDIDVVPINLVRDGRALASSYHRKFPDKKFIQAITEFLQPSFTVFEFTTGQPDLLCLRYEDLMADQAANLERIGRYVGLDYDPAALRFWEWKHHLVFGNPGTIALVRMGDGMPVGDFVGAEFYRQQFDAISSGQPLTFADNRYDAEISRWDRYVFDRLAGADNERFGYARDSFNEAEIAEFGERARGVAASGLIAEQFANQLRL